jgi:hypothetical protein
LLLTVADRIRLGACLALERAFGPHWARARDWLPEKDWARDRLEDDPLLAELDHLDAVMKDIVRLGLPRDTSREWQQPVRLALGARNRVAHYQPLPYVDFQALCSWTPVARVAQ